jgi:hypothetical protein
MKHLYLEVTFRRGKPLAAYLYMPREAEHGSNLAKNKRYDQILHLPKYARSFTNHGGVLDFYAGDHRALYPGQAEMTKTKFTYELSDHLPLWCQLDIDTVDDALEQDGGQAAE